MTKEVPIMSISQLATKLGVSARTVKRHIEKVETKYEITVTVKRGSHVLNQARIRELSDRVYSGLRSSC